MGVTYNDPLLTYDGLLRSNDYTDRDTVKSRIGQTEAADDTRLSSIITAVSRWIDAECRRFFFSVSSTQYYTPSRSTVIDVDDFTSITTLQTDIDGDGIFETTWAAKDYLIAPYNARSASPAQPYTTIQRHLYGSYVFPLGLRRSVAVTAVWGYDTTVPVVISEATILQTVRIYRRSDAPFGITGSADMGQSIVLPRLDPDVRMMLAPYKRWVVA